MNIRAYKNLPNADLLKRLKYRFRAEVADNVELSLLVQVEEEIFQLTVKNNVLRIGPAVASETANVRLSRSQLVAITARTQRLGDAPGWNIDPMHKLSELIE